MLSSLESQAFLVFGLIVGGLVVILLLFLFLGWKREIVHGSRCPYTQEVMQFGVDIAKSLQAHINAYIQNFASEDNPEIDFTKAALSPFVGRIFPTCVMKGSRVVLDWTFLQKRFSGKFVSWGSLSEEEKGIIRVLHSSLDGFQTEQSSSRVRPESVEREFALLSPGPLYVDRDTKIVMGWKRVPGTSFEILVVQRPLFQSLEETL